MFTKNISFSSTYDICFISLFVFLNWNNYFIFITTWIDALLLAVLHSKDHAVLYSIITPFCYKLQLKPHTASVNFKRLKEAIEPRIRAGRLHISARKLPISSFYQYNAR